MKKILLSMLLVILMASMVFAAAPKTINFQGRLINNDGTPVTGIRSIQVELYPTPTGGSSDWIDTFTTALDSQGVFNIILGSGSTPLDIDFNQPLWVQITYGPEVFSPRQPLSAAPYSFIAITAETAVLAKRAITADAVSIGGLGSVPIGTILPFAGNTAPTNYLSCEGSSYIVSNYPELFAVIGYTYGGSGGNFSVPDYNGYFLRGWDNGKGRDPDYGTRTGGDATTKIGSTQLDTFGSHGHSITTMRFWGESGGSWGFSGGGTAQMYTLSIGASGGNETRPDNVYVMYIIRAK